MARMATNWMDLQLFAEGEEDPDPTGGEQSEPDQGAGGDQPDDEDSKDDQQTLTLDEVKTMIQSETDKVRTEYSQKLKELREEKEELEKEKMTEEEKREFELQKMQEELEAKEQELNQHTVSLKAVELLKEAELPLEFRDFVTGSDMEATQENVDKLQQVWKEQLSKAVEARLGEDGREPHSSKREGPKDLQAQIAEAEREGDWQKAVRLKSQLKASSDE